MKTKKAQINQRDDYIFVNATTSLCPVCLSRAAAKVVRVKDEIRIFGECKQHGAFDNLLEEDADYYLRRNEFLKAPTRCQLQTPTKRGCPYDCGLCPDHEQHTCTGLIEVTQACDMGCPVCYASSASGPYLSLKKIEEMMDFFVKSEGGQAEILQISGGEPTTHPQIEEILLLAKKKSIKYIMLNTNGLRIGADDKFLNFLKTLSPGFEVYLQFDGFDAKTYKTLRGKDYSKEKLNIVKRLSDARIPTTLVTTVARGVNDHELAHITKFAMDLPAIRGINFQPMAYFGRVPSKLADSSAFKSRITMTGIMKELERQTSGEIKLSDFVPLPCNVDRVGFTFFYKKDDEFVPITRIIDAKKFVPFLKNTMSFHHKDFNAKSLFSCCVPGGASFSTLVKDLAPLIPKNFGMLDVIGQKKFIDDKTFRITIVSFIDRYSFDITAIKRECVHFITEDKKKIPFSTYNMLYRDKLYRGGEINAIRS